MYVGKTVTVCESVVYEAETGGGGGMLLINGAKPGEVAFTKSITNLNVGQNYKLSAWVANVLATGGNLPNLIFNIKRKMRSKYDKPELYISHLSYPHLTNP